MSTICLRGKSPNTGVKNTYTFWLAGRQAEMLSLIAHDKIKTISKFGYEHKAILHNMTGGLGLYLIRTFVHKL